MCIFITQGIRPNRAFEVGINISIQPDGDPNDADFFLKNASQGKYFPGGPVWHFRGKDVPTLIRWIDSGSITSEILVDSLNSLDGLGIYLEMKSSKIIPAIGWSYLWSRKLQKKEKVYLKLKSDSNALIATGKTIDQFNQKELMKILISFKRAGDKALP